MNLITRLGMFMCGLGLVASGMPVHAEKPRITTATLLINHPALATQPGAKGKPDSLRKAGDQLRVMNGEPRVVAPVGPGSAETTTWTRVADPLNGRELGYLPTSYLSEAPRLQPDQNGNFASMVDRHHALPPDYAPDDLVAIPDGLENREYRLRKAAAAALKELLDAARADRIVLKIASAYRPWSYQVGLYENAIRKRGPNQNTVAPPGHSEHQLGMAVDFADGSPGQTETTLLQAGFGETPAGRWLLRRAPDFGFAVSYTAHNRPLTGYAPEPWHYRYWGVELAPARHSEALAPAREP